MRTAAILLLVVLCFLNSDAVNGTANTNVTEVLCNSGTYSSGDPFVQSLAYVLKDLKDSAPAAEGHDYYNISPFPNAFAYGHAMCAAALTSGDCRTCLGSAKDAMLAACVARIGARSVLYDCTIRYEQYPFSG